MQGGSCTISSRGRCSGKARRTGFSGGSFGVGSHLEGLLRKTGLQILDRELHLHELAIELLGGAAVLLALQAGDLKAQLLELEFLRNRTSASATSSLALRSASATSRWRRMPFRASMSFGRSAASGMRYYTKLGSAAREKSARK